MNTWVPFTGESMAPGLKDGDELLVETFPKDAIREGDLVVTGPHLLEGKRVWSAHRVVGREGRLHTKGDRSSDWDAAKPVVGRVLGLRRGRWEIIWGERGQKLKACAVWLSKRMQAGPKGRPWRLGLKAVAGCEWLIQLGVGNVRFNSL